MRKLNTFCYHLPMSPMSILICFILSIAILVFLTYRIIEALHRIASRIESNSVHLGELRTEVSMLTEELGKSFIKMRNRQEDVISSIEAIENEVQDIDFSSDSGDVYENAKQLVLQTGKASASLIQRRLSIGYARASRILDRLEEDGIIGPAEGAKPRAVLK